MEVFVQGFVQGGDLKNFSTRLKALCGVHATTVPFERREYVYTCRDCKSANVVKKSLRLRHSAIVATSSEDGISIKNTTKWEIVFQGNFTRDDAMGTKNALVTPSRQFMIADVSDNVQAFMHQLNFVRRFEYHQVGNRTTTVDGMVVETFRLRDILDETKTLLPQEVVDDERVLGTGDHPVMVTLRMRAPVAASGTTRAAGGVGRARSLRLRKLANDLHPYFVEIRPEDTLATAIDDNDDYDHGDDEMGYEGRELDDVDELLGGGDDDDEEL